MRIFLAVVLSASIGWAGGIGGEAQGIVVGMAAGAVANHYLIKKKIGPCSNADALACTMVTVAAAQLPRLVETAMSAEDTEKSVSTGGSGRADFSASGNGYSDLGRVASVAELNGFLDSANKAKELLKKQGYEVDEKNGTIKTPRGSGPLSATGSGKDMVQAGLLDPKDAEAYDRALDEVKTNQNKIIVKSLGSAKGGYSSGRPSSKSSNSGGSDYDFSFMSRGTASIKPAQTAGLSKNYGDTPIGVATDDVFNMLSVRYRTLQEGNQFIDNPEGKYPGSF